MSLKLQQLLLEVGDPLRPLHKLSVLRLHVVLKVDYSMGTDIHLLMGDVEQHTSVVPTMLSVTKATVNLLYLTVHLCRWPCTTAEDGILMPQPPNLSCGGGGTLPVHCQTHTLLPDCPHGVVLEVEQVLHVLGQRSHPSMEVRVLEVGHGLKMLLPYGVLLILN
jgi:hypothetical protein